MGESSTGAPRIDVLDGWRGLAILMVLAGHFAPGLGIDGGFNAGRAGVELFFALSGTLIGRQLFVDRKPLRDFAARRAARILPAMWVFIAVAALWAGNGLGPTLMDAVGLANLAHNADALEHLWSVSLELQGYALLALVAFVTRRGGWRPEPLLLAIVAITWVLVAIAARRHLDGYYSVYWRAPYRLTAMVLAAGLTAWFAGGRRAPGPWQAWALAGLALQASLVPDVVKYTLGSMLLAVAAASLAVSPAHAAGTRWLAWRPLVWMGAVSYSVYLWQQVIHVARPTHSALDVVLAIALGALAHRLWDEPLHQRAKRAWLPRRAPAPATRTQGT